MHPGVDHQTARPPHLIGQPSVVAVRIGVEPGFQAEALGIQAPSLDEGGEAFETAEFGQIQFLLQRDLQVMPRHGLVQRQGLQFVQGPAGQVVGVDVVGTGAGAVAGAFPVVGRRRLRRHVVRHGLDPVRQAR